MWVSSIKLCSGAVLFGSVLPSALYAAEQLNVQVQVQEELDAAWLPTVSVSATRTERDAAALPATVSVIEAAELSRQLSFDIKDLIRYEPGVSVATSPARFGNAGFNIQGIDGNRVLLQVDGVRVPDSFSIGSFSNAGRVPGARFSRQRHAYGPLEPHPDRIFSVDVLLSRDAMSRSVYVINSDYLCGLYL